MAGKGNLSMIQEQAEINKIEIQMKQNIFFLSDR